MCMHAHHRHENYAVGRVDDESRIDRRQRQFRFLASRFGWAVVICTAIWAVTGHGYFWPMWVIAFGAIRLALLARDAYGRTPDPSDNREDDLVEV